MYQTKSRAKAKPNGKATISSGLPAAQPTVKDPRLAVPPVPTRRRSHEEPIPSAIPDEPKLIAHLPDLTHSHEVQSQYRDVSENQFPVNGGGDRYAALRGLRKNDVEATECFCTYLASDPPSACGVDCINRQTAIECDNSCPTGKHCLNKRLQRKQWIKSSVVHVGPKGYGLRADEPVEENNLVIEYVGEVIGPVELARRKQTYINEGLHHFYFMSLGRDQYVDATKVACRARFLNHSCRPNCQVVKWHVGTAVRMGVYAVRPIVAGEELTFN